MLEFSKQFKKLMLVITGVVESSGLITPFCHPPWTSRTAAMRRQESSATLRPRRSNRSGRTVQAHRQSLKPLRRGGAAEHFVYKALPGACVECQNLKAAMEFMVVDPGQRPRQ